MPNFFIAFALIFFFFFFFNGNRYWVQCFSGPHIADVNILLPPKMTHPVEYRLLGSDGCFKWSWDHHDVLSVVPEYNESNHCSTSARLRSIAPYTGRKETAVYAADVRTGFVVRCKVYIDMFSKIQIFHSSVKLDLDGLATLRVRAFDSEDNVFSSLVGLRFMWQLMPESDKSSHHLVHVPLSDSPLSDCSGFCGDLNIQTKLEDSGVYSDLFVVKGIGIGHEIVSVYLLEPQFDNMTDKIILTVAEAMSLDPPSPVLVLVGATVQYSLKVIRGNIPQGVSLPSPFHRWSVLNTSVAQVDAMTGLVHASKLGETSIIVEDTRVAGHAQMSSLHVVLPDYMSLYLLPLSKSGEPVEGVKPTALNARWYVVSGRQYLIKLKVFSRGPDARVIYLSKNEDVKLYYDQPEHWKNFLIPDSIAVKNSWQYSRMLEATVEGLGKLSASLTYSTGDFEAKEVLKVVQEVMVCDPVIIKEEERNTSLTSLLLPWSPTIYQEAQLNALGGCANSPADYRWLSSDNSILSVSASGVVQAKRPGKAIVKVVSIFDDLNFDEVNIEVALPSSMVMLPDFPVETVVGSHLQAAVSMKASNGAFFYRCDAFSSSIKWSTESEFFIIVSSTIEESLKNGFKTNEQSNYGPVCARTYLKAASPGRTVLHATFSAHTNNGFSKQILLKTSAPIASFSPLTIRQAGDGNKFGGYWFNLEEEGAHDELNNLNYLYLAPGAQLNVVLTGGPERWRKEVDYIETVEVLDEMCALPKDGALVQEIRNSEGSGYAILCQVLGNFTLVFKRGNLVGDDHPQPVVAEAKLRLDCNLPSSIVVLADEPVNKLDIIQNAIQADRDPGRIRSMPRTVANERTIRLSAIGISNSGNAFANSSSIPLRWELNNCQELATWDEAYNSRVSVSCWERYLRLENASGQCTVHAVVQNHFNYGSSLSELDASDNVLRDAVRLQVVSTLQVFPEFSLLFFNPEAKIYLSVVGGSCFLEVHVNDSRVVEVMQPTTGLQCSRLTLVPRGVGTALVKVTDVGLSPPLKAASTVKVAEVDWLKIIPGKGISLMEGSLISIELLAGTDDGNIFESSQHAFMNIKVHIKDQIVDLVDGENLIVGDGYINASNFTLYGSLPGVTTLYVSSRQQSGREIYSGNITVEVYSPPFVHPSDIFLVPGASYVGGPRIGVLIEYTSMNDSTVAVHASVGRLSTIAPGNATIVATFYGNGRAVLCQAHGKVRVGIPSAAILNVQSEQLAVGREMPIFPVLVEGDLFSFYEFCMNYKWTIDNEKVVGFHPAEHIDDYNYKLPNSDLSSYEYEQEIDFIKILSGRSGGRSKVSLTFTCDFSSPRFSLHSRSYSASVLIRVVPDPPLAQGIPITWVLPPHYTTSDLLPSYSKSHMTMDIQSQTRSVAYSLLRSSERNEDQLQRGIISVSGNRIRTTDSNDLACIQAKDLSTGRIEVATCVRVAEVAQIRFPRKLIFHLAVGAELELPVYFYDNLGIPFLEAHDVAVLDIETNYKDILAIDKVNQKNGSTVIKAMQHGRALVGVRYDGNPQKSDYIMVSVGAHITPQDPILHPGSNMNFSVEGINGQASGRWSSGDESVVSVDSLSGKAVAVGKGTVSVTFQTSSLKLQTNVRVLNGDLISVHTPMDIITNSPIPPGGYKFSVKFSNHGLGGPNKNVELPYECQVEPTFVGHAKPWKDLDTGDSYCLFFPYSPEHLVHTVPKLKDKTQDISISMHVKLRDANDVSSSASVLFLGGFSILDMDKLNLTRNFNRSIITVVGNTDLSIHWLNRDLLMVRTLHKEGSGIGGRAQYEVKVLKPKPFKDTITFSLPANGQRVELHINYEVGKEKASTTVNTLWAGVTGLTLLILTLVIFICFLDRPKSTRSSISIHAQNVATPQTPERSSQAPQTERSPRTPQPFIDYVRRTIDETPYYTRDRRRRFDPQNTY